MPKYMNESYSDNSESEDISDRYSMLSFDAIDAKSFCKSKSVSSSNSISIKFATDIIVI